MSITGRWCQPHDEKHIAPVPVRVNCASSRSPAVNFRFLPGQNACRICWPSHRPWRYMSCADERPSPSATGAAKQAFMASRIWRLISGFLHFDRRHIGVSNQAEPFSIERASSRAYRQYRVIVKLCTQKKRDFTMPSVSARLSHEIRHDRAASS